MKNFQLDIITPTNIVSYESVSYVRIPALDGLTGVQSKHANAIIGLDIGEIKVTKDNKEIYFSTSGGFADIKPESVQLLLETFESKESIDQKRAKDSLKRAKERRSDKKMDIERAENALLRAKNRLKIFNK
jgi:F-type H+-transporting ATPase subunit epsilon